ncbi:hypothetical protein OQA88_10633 [Cercophora sp. LCS_1]
MLFIIILALVGLATGIPVDVDTASTDMNVTSPETEVLCCQIGCVACYNVDGLIDPSWSVLHLNVPPQFQPQTQSQRLQRDLKQFFTKLKWTLLMLVLPEGLFGKAALSYWVARCNSKHLSDFAKDDGTPWSITHTFFADMGGFVLRFRHDALGQDPNAKLYNAWDLSHDLGKYERRYGQTAWKPHGIHTPLTLQVPEDDAQLRCQLGGNTWVLSSCQLIQARKMQLITRLPDVTVDEIMDRSKTDPLVKVLALLQVSWFAVELLVRTINHKPSSPLEVMTLSFAICAVVMFLLLLSHPKDVSTPIYLDSEICTSAEHIEKLASLRSVLYWTGDFNMACISTSNNAIPRIWRKKLLEEPNSRASGRPTFQPVDTEIYLMSLGIGFGSAISGGAHLLAWNSPFPIYPELLIWRGSSIVTAILPLLMVAYEYFIDRVLRRNDTTARIAVYLNYFNILLLALLRLFLIVEAFRSLYYISPEVYSTTWTVGIPHV